MQENNSESLIITQIEAIPLRTIYTSSRQSEGAQIHQKIANDPILDLLAGCLQNKLAGGRNFRFWTEIRLLSNDSKALGIYKVVFLKESEWNECFEWVLIDLQSKEVLITGQFLKEKLTFSIFEADNFLFLNVDKKPTKIHLPTKTISALNENISSQNFQIYIDIKGKNILSLEKKNYSDNSKIYLYRLLERESKGFEIPLFNFNISLFAFSGDETIFCCVSEFINSNTLKIYSTNPFQKKSSMKIPTKVTKIILNGDGSLLAMTVGFKVAILAVEKMEILLIINECMPANGFMGFSKDRISLYRSGENRTKIYDISVLYENLKE